VSLRLFKLESELSLVLKITLLGREILIKPRRSDVVIFDLQVDLRTIIRPLSFIVFDPRYKVLFLVPLLQAFFRRVVFGKRGSFTEEYFLHFLQQTKPKLVITTIDNSSTFYAVRGIYVKSDCRFVAIQNGCRWLTTMPSSASSLQSQDMILCLTEEYAEEWRKVAPRARVIATGTFASKLPVEKKVRTKNTAGFISTWKIGHVVQGERRKSTHFGEHIRHSDFYAPERTLLPALKSVLNSLGITLHVMGRSVGLQQEAEFDFYYEILGREGWKYAPRSKGSPSYSSMWSYDVLFCVTSTLSYEALALGHTVMFLEVSEGDSFHESPSAVRQPFGYPKPNNHYKSALHLRESQVSTWGNQIRTVTSWSKDRLAEEATRVLGKTPMTTSLEDLVSLLDLPSQVSGK